MTETELLNLVDASAIVALMKWLYAPDPPPSDTVIDNKAATLISQGLLSLVSGASANAQESAGASLAKFAKLGLSGTATGTDKGIVPLRGADDVRHFALKVGESIPVGGNAPYTVCFVFPDGIKICVQHYV